MDIRVSCGKSTTAEGVQDDQEIQLLTTLTTDLERQQTNDLDAVRNEHDHYHRNVSDKKDTKFLDGLRGLAALCVFNQHLMSSIEHHHGFAENEHYYFISLPFIRIFYSGGAAAVAIFFVLSGYVLSQSAVNLVQNRELPKCKRHLLGAVLRRPMRLYLPCFCITFGVALLMHVPFMYPEGPWSHAQPYLLLEISHWMHETVQFFNPFEQHAWTNARYSYDTPLWTIPIELKGSLLIYGLCFVHCSIVAPSSWSALSMMIATAVLLQIGWWTGACFVGGLALSMIDNHGLDKFRCLDLRSWIKKLTLHSLFIVGYYFLSQPALDGHREVSAQTPGWKFLTSLIPRTYDDDSYYRFYHSCGALMLLYATLRIRWLQKVFTLKLLQCLGRISFMLYVLHWPVLVGFDRLRHIIGGGLPGTQSHWSDDMFYIPDVGPKGMSLRWIIEWILMLSFTSSIAHLCTRYIDKPVIRLGKICTDRFGLSHKS